MSKTIHHPTLPVRWNALALLAIRDTGTPPPMAARILAILHTCMYDAWAMYDVRAESTRLAGLLRRPAAAHSEENLAETISHAAYRALKEYFPETVLADNKTRFEDMMQALGYDPTNLSDDPGNPVGIANRMAKAVLDHRRGDGANTFQTLQSGKPYADYTAYAPALGPDDLPIKDQKEHWQPLRVKKTDGTEKVQAFVAPHWGLVQPFALRNGAQYRPLVGGEAWYTARFGEQCQYLIDLSANLTDEHKAIAEYWADGPNSVTPPGHWCLHAQWVSRRDLHDTDQDVKLFFALSNALFDAGIAAWDCKRAFDYVRPVTAIRHHFAGKKICAWGGPGRTATLMDGSAWQPYQPLDFVTPPFAEYVSGHSTFSSAAAEILRFFTGSDRFGLGVDIAAGSSKIAPGTTPSHAVRLEWATFSQAAQEAGLSRLYGGIHFPDGNIRGLELGKKVANRTWQKAERLWSGTEF